MYTYIYIYPTSHGIPCCSRTVSAFGLKLHLRLRKARQTVAHPPLFGGGRFGALASNDLLRKHDMGMLYIWIYIYIYGYWYMGSLHEKCGMWFCSEKYMGSILEQTDFAKKNLARLLEIWEPIETLESAMVNKCCSTTIGNCDQPEIFGTCGDFTSIDWSIFILIINDSL